MILTVQHLVDLLQRPPFGLNPIVTDKRQLQDIPTAVDHVCLPADGVEGKGEDPGDEETDAVDGEGVDAHADGTHGVVHDLWRVEDGERGPADGVGALEEEDHGDGAVDAGEVGGVAEGGVEPADEEKEDCEQRGRHDGDGLAADLVGEPGAYAGADEAEGV